MNINKQAGFSMIEIALAMWVVAALLCVTMLLASPKKTNEQVLAKDQHQSQTIEKKTLVLEDKVLKSIH